MRIREKQALTVELVAQRATAAYRETVECETCNTKRALTWYDRKRAWIVRNKREDITNEQACTVYAVLSQDRSVPLNDKLYLAAMRGEHVGHYGVVVDRVRKALAGDIEGALSYKNGEKIPNFKVNLEFPRRNGFFTADRHMGDIVTRNRTVTKNMLAWGKARGYNIIKDGMSLAAGYVGLLPLKFQAALWIHQTECKGGIKSTVRCA